MKYLALVYQEEKLMNAMTQQEWDALNQECMACGAELTDSGRMLTGEALQSVETAATVRVRNGELTTTDGPFAETKEQLASRIPPARYGCVEVRPVRELATQGNAFYGQETP